MDPQFKCFRMLQRPLQFLIASAGKILIAFQVDQKPVEPAVFQAFYPLAAADGSPQFRNIADLVRVSGRSLIDRHMFHAVAGHIQHQQIIEPNAGRSDFYRAVMVVFILAAYCIDCLMYSIAIKSLVQIIGYCPAEITAPEKYGRSGGYKKDHY